MIYYLIFLFILKNIQSDILNYIPFVGHFKNLYELLCEKDLITGKNLTDSERILFLFRVLYLIIIN